MWSKELSIRSAFIFLCLSLICGFAKTGSVYRRQAGEEDGSALRANREKLEGQVSSRSRKRDAEDVSPLDRIYINQLAKLRTENSNLREELGHVKDADDEEKSASSYNYKQDTSYYLKLISELKKENEEFSKNIRANEALKKENDELKRILGAQRDEEVTDEDLNNPALPEQKKPYHPLIGDEDVVEKLADSVVQVGVPLRNNLPAGAANALEKQSDHSPDSLMINAEDAQEKDDTKVIWGRDPNVAETEDEKRAREKKEKSDQRTDVVTLTVAAIALLCAVIFIVFTVVQWRSTLKAIKMDQMRSNQSIKSLRSDLSRYRSMSSIGEISDIMKVLEEEVQDMGPSSPGDSANTRTKLKKTSGSGKARASKASKKKRDVDPLLE